MSILKIKDWLLIKSGIQFKSNLTRGFTRIVDGVDFYLNDPMTYLNDGEWSFVIDRFSSDLVHVDCHVRKLNGGHINSFVCEINDIKIIKYSGSKMIIYSYVDRSPKFKPRRRIAIKK